MTFTPMHKASAPAVDVPDAGVSAGDVRVSRRRVLQGVAWATPAVVIAAAAPAAAASDPGRQSPVTPSGKLTSAARGELGSAMWVGGVNYGQVARVSTYVQLSRNDAVPSTTPVDPVVALSVQLVVNNSTSQPSWGIGYNGTGASGSWQLDGLAVTSGRQATLTLKYTGSMPINEWGGVNLDNLWIQVDSRPTSMTLTVIGLDQAGNSLITPSPNLLP